MASSLRLAQYDGELALKNYLIELHPSQNSAASAVFKLALAMGEQLQQQKVMASAAAVSSRPCEGFSSIPVIYYAGQATRGCGSAGTAGMPRQGH